MTSFFKVFFGLLAFYYDKTTEEVNRKWLGERVGKITSDGTGRDSNLVPLLNGMVP